MYHGPSGVPWPWGVPWPSRGVPWPLYEDHVLEPAYYLYSRLTTMPITYEVRDLDGEVIKGRFYEAEIQKVLKSDDERLDIDRIIKTRKRDGNEQYLLA